MNDSATAVLVLSQDSGEKIISLMTQPFIIGRVASNDLVLSDEEASRKHAQITVANGEYVIVDLSSRNGTFVNGSRIQRSPLHPGDQIRIGATLLRFDLSGPGDSLDQSQLGPTSSAVIHDGLEEPTAMRNWIDVDLSRKDQRALEQLARLFRTELSPQGILQQLTDLCFEYFAPDRTQVWMEKEVSLAFARSRSEGKDCSSFEVPACLLQKAFSCATYFLENISVNNSQETRSVLVSPIRVAGEIRGWIYLDRSSSLPPYGPKDVERLGPLALIAGGVLERSALLGQNKHLSEQMLRMEKFVSPEVAKAVGAQTINPEEGNLNVEEKEVSILFADIQGFTSLSEKLTASELANLLNEYFQRMVDVIGAYHGEVNKFIGDAIMAIFGAPKSFGNDAVHAVAAALEMLKTLAQFWKEVDERKRFNIRIGINTGVVVAGNIGCEKRMEYTVLGDEVNVASRLEGISPANTITVGQRTADLVRDFYTLELVPAITVKGKSKTLNVYRVIGPVR